MPSLTRASAFGVFISLLCQPTLCCAAKIPPRQLLLPEEREAEPEPGDRPQKTEEKAEHARLVRVGAALRGGGTHPTEVVDHDLDDL